ncbi:MAG: hypothetical protein HY248_04360 [Fimbriimonas ginsengisoli]|uniref:Uncharacterized protein n=1 Tax=Fimbriimonas ginsengisoli TaxID=1005039 RepID=A0A931LZB2_FIMGI|nr:hypothetical protein [Fimbriimonas ginsengisoli]MBI3721766.1 hypothetical protein [Fimbriimonas ginsengisoli]
MRIWKRKNAEDEGIDNLSMGPLELDLALERADQLEMARLVKTLVDEQPSLTWRSALNERLRSVDQTQRRRRGTAWVWRAGVALGLAASVLVGFLIWPVAGTVQVPSGAVESGLIRAFREEVAANEVAGAGATPLELDQNGGESLAPDQAYEDTDAEPT